MAQTGGALSAPLDRGPDRVPVADVRRRDVQRRRELRTQVGERVGLPDGRHHPLADGEGYVYAPDIDPVAQMVDLISASRSYQANVEVFNSAKELAMATLNMGR